jgi:alginate biosynthesis protein Alg44
MQAQIVHEAEVHRQHVRLKIPIQAELDGVRYQLDDWSVGGFGVESVMTSRQAGEHFPMRLIFPFEEFEMTMRMEARMVYVDQDHGRFGGAFQGLSREQMEVFRYLVDAYLSGEVVSAGDILQVRARDNTARARVQPLHAILPEDEPWVLRLRRYGGLIGAAVAGLALVAVIGVGIQARFFIRVSTSAVVEAPLVQIRAPIAGRLIGALESGDRVPAGALVGTILGFDGLRVELESPCDCVVLEQIGRSGQHYQVGDTLAALIEAGQPLLIRAQLPLDQATDLEVGARAEIQFPGRDEPQFGQIERLDFRPRRPLLHNPDAAQPIDRRRAQVLIRPDQALEPADFGALVTVNFL